MEAVGISKGEPPKRWTRPRRKRPAREPEPASRQRQCGLSAFAISPMPPAISPRIMMVANRLVGWK